MDYKIWNYVLPGVQHDEDQSPLDIDFKTGLTVRLHPERIFDNGVLVEVIHNLGTSVNPDGTLSFSDPVVQEKFEYTRDPYGFALYRVQTISWYLEDGTIGPDTKTLQKFYSPQERIAELERRRRNIVDNVKIIVIGAIAATQQVDTSEAVQLGRAFFDDHQIAIANYIESGGDALIQGVEGDNTHVWLNNQIAPQVTIRAFLLNELT